MKSPIISSSKITLKNTDNEECKECALEKGISHTCKSIFDSRYDELQIDLLQSKKYTIETVTILMSVFVGDIFTQFSINMQK